jgi:uncharacterized membrane protein
METAHPERVFTRPAHGFGVLSKRNCSISPAGLWRVFAAIALLTLGIGIGFACFGAWLILPFAGLELLVLAAAFVVVGRHATDCERIEFSAGRIRVEVRETERTSLHEFDPMRARVVLGGGRGGMRVWLLARDARLEIGRHLDCASRAGLAVELRRWLHGTGEGRT